MRNFSDRMAAGKDAAAAKRHRGEMTGKAAKGWIAHKPPGDAADLDQFDHYLNRIKAMVRDGLEDYAAAMLRIREADLGAFYADTDEIPF